MLFTSYFNLEIFSAAAEYFSISKSHHDNEQGISEQLQCIWSEISMQSDRQIETDHSQTDHPTYSHFTEHAIVIHRVSVLCALSTCTIKKDKSSLLQHILAKPNLYSGPFCWAHRSPHLAGCRSSLEKDTAPTVHNTFYYFIRKHLTVL